MLLGKIFYTPGVDCNALRQCGIVPARNSPISVSFRSKFRNPIIAAGSPVFIGVRQLACQQNPGEIGGFCPVFWDCVARASLMVFLSLRWPKCS